MKRVGFRVRRGGFRVRGLGFGVKSPQDSVGWRRPTEHVTGQRAWPQTAKQVSDCVIKTGNKEDAIAIKSGEDEFGLDVRPQPAKIRSSAVETR